MDKNIDIIEAKRFMAAISKSALMREFLNKRKLAKSSLLEGLLKEQLKHAQRHGDWPIVIQTIDVFKSSNVYEVILRWCCAVGGFDFKVKDKAVRLKRRCADAESVPVSLSDYIDAAASDCKRTQSALISYYSKRNGARPDVDALSRRVPGSYGAGKKR